MLPLGVVGQAVLGGFTVKGALDYGWVMGHFALSMLILVGCHGARLASLESRARGSGCGGARAADRTLVWSVARAGGPRRADDLRGDRRDRGGPHAGGSPGQKINRLDFDGRGTMDFVIHRHAEIASCSACPPSALVARAPPAPAGPGAAPADHAVRAAGAAGSGGPRSIRDASSPPSSSGYTSAWPVSRGWRPSGPRARRDLWRHARRPSGAARHAPGAGVGLSVAVSGVRPMGARAARKGCPRGE